MGEFGGGVIKLEWDRFDVSKAVAAASVASPLLVDRSSSPLGRVKVLAKPVDGKSARKTLPT